MKRNSISSAIVIGALAMAPLLTLAQTNTSTNTNANMQSTTNAPGSSMGSGPSMMSTTGTSGQFTMPTLYSTPGGQTVNGSGSNSTLAAGWYYLVNGDKVYYYGNGTYYDENTQQYGGSVNNANGTAGTYSGSTGSTGTTGMTGSTRSPGVPSTGAGGNVVMNLAILFASGLIATFAAVYVRKQTIV